MVISEAARNLRPRCQRKFNTLISNALERCAAGRVASPVAAARFRATLQALGRVARTLLPPESPMPLSRHLTLCMLGALTTLACVQETGDPLPELEDQSLPTSARFQAVSVVDDQIVWIAGVEGAVARSLDGGTHWERVSVPGADSLQFRDVHAVSGSTAYLLSAGPGERSRIYRTTDGGESWSLQFVNDIPDAFFDCLAFWDATSGIAFSDAVDGAFVIIQTADGTAWQRIPPTDLPPAATGEGGFAASGTCVTTVDDSSAWIGTGNASPTRVLVTHDRGRTWHAYATPIASGEAAGITSVAVWTADTVIVVGGAIGEPESVTDRVARSTDGGKTWSRGGVPPFPGAAYGAAYVRASDPPALVAVGPGGAAASFDHGASWALLDSADYWGLGVAGTSVGWLVGPGGRVTKLSLPTAQSR
jgi:photosystem II stability/assembly factor-like uncharacterized protein